MSIHFLQGADVSATIAKLRRLADDLEKMTMFVPGDIELAEAPVLDNWSPSARLLPALVGQVSGHPLLGQRRIRTSDVYAVGKDGTWCRTFSRFYKLGQRYEGDAAHG